MANNKPMQFLFEAIKAKEPTFRVRVARGENLDVVGTICDQYVRHLNRRAWAATGPDGHRGMHEHQWQAALALTWDGTGYPFPYPASRKREVMGI